MFSMRDFVDNFFEISSSWNIKKISFKLLGFFLMSFGYSKDFFVFLWSTKSIATCKHKLTRGRPSWPGRAGPSRFIMDSDYVVKKNIFFRKPYRKKNNSFRHIAYIDIILYECGQYSGWKCSARENWVMTFNLFKKINRIKTFDFARFW